MPSLVPMFAVQTSGWRVLNLRSTAVGLWEVWLAHMVAFGVGADEGNSIGVSVLPATSRETFRGARARRCCERQPTRRYWC